MKCTDKCFKRISIFLIMAVLFSGCGSLRAELPYHEVSGISGFSTSEIAGKDRVSAFASGLCIAPDENKMSESVDMSGAISAGLFDVNNSTLLYSKNIHERLHPASLTKIMTAYVAMKYGSMDQILTAGNSVNISESGAQLCGLRPGDKMTLDQALHALLMYSANDAANLIAEGIGGSVESFVELMNSEALSLGATNTHFSNPHGLTQEDHYTTAYDLYLIFNAAVRNEKFREIISMKTYDTVYTDKDGAEKEMSVKNTNQFLQGEYAPPENMTVIGGKTGTTNAAGHCLVILARDIQGAPYIAIILGSDSREDVYREMIELLGEIGK